MLLTRLAEGELLSDILKTPGMPSRVSIIRLLKVDEEFNQHYLLAKEMQADAIFDRHFKRAVLERDPNKMTDASERLAFEAAKWALGKLMPKKYGDKIQNEVTGADGAPLPVMIYLPSNGRDPVPASDETGDAEPE